MRWSLGIGLILAGWASIGGAQAQSTSTTDWSGFYIGAGVGAAYGEPGVEMTTDGITTGNAYFNFASDHSEVSSEGTGNLYGQKMAGGVTTGYGRQFGHVLVGIEAGANSLFLDDERTASRAYSSVATVQFHIRERVKASWQATVRGRLGWADDNWLAFVTAGAAASRVKVDVSFSDENGAVAAQGGGSDKAILPGWTAGFGGEYALGRNWSLRAEYLYADYGSTDMRFRVVNTGGLNNFVDVDTDLRTHTALIGLTYRFGDF